MGGARLRDDRRGIGGRGRRGRRPGVRVCREKERKEEEGNREAWDFHGVGLHGSFNGEDFVCVDNLGFARPAVDAIGSVPGIIDIFIAEEPSEEEQEREGGE